MDWNPDDFIARVKRAADVAIFKAAEVGAATARAMITTATGVPSKPGEPPNMQSGELVGKLFVASPAQLGKPGHAAYGTSAKHGRYMEFGATVVAKHVKALPVPINAKARYMLSHMHGQSLRTKNMQMIKRRGKPPMLVETTPTGKIKKDGAMFVLRRSVVIKPRPWLFPSLKRAETAIIATYAECMKQELNLA